MYYLCSESKGADQFCSYCEADLRLCYSPMQIVGFPMGEILYQLCSTITGPLLGEMIDNMRNKTRKDKPISTRMFMYSAVSCFTLVEPPHKKTNNMHR